MTRLKVFAFLFAALVLGGFARGGLPISLTAFIQDNSQLYLIDSGGGYVVLSDRTIANSTYKVVCVGDSITDIAVQPPGYCPDVVGLLASNRAITASWKSVGMSGYSWNYSFATGPWVGATINSQSPSQVDTEIYPGLTNILVGFAGTNGMFVAFGNHSAATEFADFQTWFNARIAAGWTASNIIVVTTLPRQDDASFDTKRATLNASIISFCASNGCKVADAGGDATIGCNGCEDNLTYFQSNKIHLNVDGLVYLATNLIYPQIP